MHGPVTPDRPDVAPKDPALPGPSGPRVRSLGLLAVGLACAWSAIAFYALRTALPHSPLELPGERAIDMRRVLPQGWGFFTRDPQEPWRTTYVRDAGGWRPATDRQMSASQWWGAKRLARRVGAESAYLTEELWAIWSTPCEGSPLACLDAIEVAEELEAPFPGAMLCGEIAMVEQAPVPFAWRELGVVEMPSLVMKVRVKC
ncbi:MAG: SdpA family antimicrobial peptide system protein [Deltaproteobacteria bacterium]|nr:SdpA family antimicrobial peptide system protein [Deltaproteobacteria bacterium]MBK8713564.1 SdpA family antimicrobial peptide system protein [Deltaproteobacteria bacterium]